MKYINTAIMMLSLTTLLTAQSFTQQPTQSIYLDNSSRNNSLLSFNMMPYNGAGKQFLLDNLPGLWQPAITKSYGPIAIYNHPNGQIFNSMYFENQIITLDVSRSHLGENEYSVQNNNQFGNFKLFNAVNAHFYNKNYDANEDGFRDLDHKNRLFAHSFLNYQRRKNNIDFHTTNIIYYMHLVKEGGQLEFDKAVDSTHLFYGNGHHIQQGGFSSKNTVHLLKNKTIKQKITLHLDGRWHDQDSYFGTTNFHINESVFNQYLAYHQDRSLSSFSITAYGQQVNFSDSLVQAYQFNRFGLVGYMDLSLRKWVKWKTSLKYENTANTWHFLPSTKLQFAIPKSQHQNLFFVALYAGRDNTLNRFTAAYLPFMNSYNGLNYDNISTPHQEFAWYAGSSIQVERFKLNNVSIEKVKIAWNSSSYDNRIVAYNNNDLITLGIADAAIFHTLESSIHASFHNFKLNLFHRFQLNESDINNSTVTEWLLPKHTFASELSYSKYNVFQLSLACFWQSSQLLFDGSDSQNNYRIDLMGTYNFNYNATFDFLKYFSVFGGIQNITNYKQQDLIQGTPFSNGFNAGQIWGNTVGFRVLGGIRYKF